jgi:hypothetical protein
VPSCHTYTALVVDTVGARPSTSYMRECWVLRAAAGEGALVQAWGAASQRRPVGEGMDVGAVEGFGCGEQNVG